MFTALLLFAAVETAPAKPPSLAGLPPIPKDAVRVFLVRHGQALSNLKPRPNLSPEELDHLTPRGREQTARAAKMLAGQGVRAVVTSPAGRAKETGDILRKALGVGEAPLERGLRSLEIGRSAAGQTLSWAEREREWTAGRDPQPPDGESIQQVSDRMLDVIRSLAAARPGQAVVLVSHGEVIAALLGALQSLPSHERENLEPANASVSVVDAAVGKAPKLVLVDVSAEEAKP